LPGSGEWQQHDAQAPPVALGRADEAAARAPGVAGLEADRAAVARPDERVAGVEVELAALRREGQDRLGALHDRGDPRLVEGRARERRKVLRAGEARVVEAVGEAKDVQPRFISCAVRFMSATNFGTVPLMRWASAIAASLPETIISPLSSALTPTRRFLGSTPTREPGRARASFVTRTVEPSGTGGRRGAPSWSS
jgi:hypothetical protein